MDHAFHALAGLMTGIVGPFLTLLGYRIYRHYRLNFRNKILQMMIGAVVIYLWFVLPHQLMRIMPADFQYDELLSLGCFVGILTPLVVLIWKSKQKYQNKNRKILKRLEQKSEQKRVSFTGISGKTTVIYEDLEIMEDPETGERMVPGERFNGEFVESMVTEDWCPGPKKSFFRNVCTQCGHILPEESVQREIVRSSRFGSSKDFRVKVITHFLECAECGKLHAADTDEFLAAHESALEKAELI